MSRSRAAVLLATAVAAGATLTACGGETAGDVAGSTTAATPAPTSAATTTAEATEAPTEAPSTDGKVTPLGTTLKIGEAAVINYKDSTTNAKSLIELTPKKIEKGSLDDFKNIDLDADQKSSTPYYATIAVKNIGKGDLSGGSPATYINAVDDRGQDQNEIIFFGSFDRCDSTAPKKIPPGASYEACLAYLIPGGGSVKGFHWIQFDEKSGKSDLNWK